MAAPFALVGIDHIVLRAADPAALERFYIDVLEKYIVGAEVGKVDWQASWQPQSVTDEDGRRTIVASANQLLVPFHFARLGIEARDSTGVAFFVSQDIDFSIACCGRGNVAREDVTGPNNV